MASGSDLGDRSRFAKLGMAIAEELTQACRDVLEMEVCPKHVFNKVKSSSLSKRIHSGQELVLKNAANNGYKNFDISLLYILIRHICVMIPRPTKGKWGLNTMPSVRETTIGDDIERIRIIRNTYSAHQTSASTSKKEFNEIWSVISDVCQRLEMYTRKDYMSGLRKIQRHAFIEEHEESAKEKLKGLHDNLTENVEESIPPHYIEKLEKSLRENAIITVQHSRGILVGCAEAGKTTLLNRLMGETQEVVEDIESSRGLEVHHHVFNIRNGCLEVSADERRQKSFLWVGISDLNTDTDVKTDRSKSKKIDSNIQIIYQREEGEGQTSVEIERELDEEQEKTSDSSVQSDTEPFTIPREILLKIMDDKEKIPTISMLDLAGQFAYYACHQIYITKGVFFILVLNVNQKFEDKVSTEENNQEGSVFSTWTYKEYVKFWINSIKTFGRTKAPVLIVATHTEEKSEGEIDEFFAKFWEAVPEEDRDWLIESVVDSEYDIGLLNLDEIGKETLESIKSSIIKAATEKINNKIDVPSTWALLEQVVREKRRKVMSYEEIWEVNTKRFPSEFQLENKAMLSGFLKFFHRHGLLLWFEEGNINDNHLHEKVVLDIQWFASAVNKLIADKNHIHKDCKRRYYKEWDSFNKTGKIEEKLVMNLWKDESSYLNHITEIMTYMEKLLMLVAFHSKNDAAETDKSWYVPSMNKRVFKEDFSEETCQYSSILCFRFSSFAMFVYYRVVAYCMSVLKWTVSRDEEGLCLYQTAAVFDFKNHTVIIGVSENDIQVQVKLIKPSVIQTDISAEVGESVEVACKNLAKTFHEDIHFVKGYKCRRNFCDAGDRSFTPAIELANDKGEIQCQYCSVSGKHTINVEETLRFWKKIDKGLPTQDDKAHGSTNDDDKTLRRGCKRKKEMKDFLFVHSAFLADLSQRLK
ncbi:uncharacterized protein LOC134256468 [Saccostrea cucullata]|uniref:uncharacterized protein LOC134256468 n=1 Tax=Saccostrea cuccullata TaxID=36930 RepID=UPI002ED3C314